MISCISSDNVHKFGSAYHSLFRLRHAEFIERQHYDVPAYEGMEFDQYDTPAARYLVYHTDDGQALGVTRLTPTALSCMLKDLWPDMVTDKSLLQSPTVWEGSRYAVDKDVAPALRQQIINEMACAYLEFGLAFGIERIIGLMPTFIYRSVFERPGIRMERLGEVRELGGFKCRAVAIPVSAQQLANVRHKTGIAASVLTFGRDGEGSAYARAA